MVIHDAKKQLVFLLKTDKIIVMEFILMTSNIRFENPNDGLNNWHNRRPLWADIIRK